MFCPEAAVNHHVIEVRSCPVFTALEDLCGPVWCYSVTQVQCGDVPGSSVPLQQIIEPWHWYASNLDWALSLQNSMQTRRDPSFFGKITIGLLHLLVEGFKIPNFFITLISSFRGSTCLSGTLLGRCRDGVGSER